MPLITEEKMGVVSGWGRQAFEDFGGKSVRKCHLTPPPSPPKKQSKKNHFPELSYPDSTLHQVKLELLSNKECIKMFRCSQDHAYYVTKKISLLDHVP